MGYYINPTDGSSKEQWLETHGAKAHAREVRMIVDAGDFTELVPVCLVDNGWMTAAGIGYNPSEARHFLDTADDGRPRTWYLCKRDDLKPYCSVL